MVFVLSPSVPGIKGNLRTTDGGICTLLDTSLQSGTFLPRAAEMASQVPGCLRVARLVSLLLILLSSSCAVNAMAASPSATQVAAPEQRINVPISLQPTTGTSSSASLPVATYFPSEWSVPASLDLNETTTIGIVTPNTTAPT
jgi:hypothetical protein